MAEIILHSGKKNCLIECGDAVMVSPFIYRNRAT